MEEKTVRIGKAAEMLGVTIQTLRNWEKSGKLRASRSSGGQRYYNLQDLQRFSIDMETLGWAWASSAQPPEIGDEFYCERQDRFTSRLNKMSVVVSDALGDSGIDIVSLVTLVVGEIGDNSFAHNIGNWTDIPGLFFGCDMGRKKIVLADRGRGVLTTLRQVRPNLVNDLDAMRVAFTEVVSGRSPEQRGNGLKVVRSVAEKNAIGVVMRSGLGKVEIPRDSDKMSISQTKENIRGTYIIIYF